MARQLHGPRVTLLPAVACSGGAPVTKWPCAITRRAPFRQGCMLHDASCSLHTSHGRQRARRKALCGGHPQALRVTSPNTAHAATRSKAARNSAANSPRPAETRRQTPPPPERSRGHARPRRVLKSSIMSSRPRLSGTRGSHPRLPRTFVMSGLRCFGSSTVFSW